MLLVLLGTATLVQAQQAEAAPAKELKTFLIERSIPNAGKFTPEELKAISQKSCAVLKEMGEGIIWVHSYVTGNKIYCIYQAADEKLIRAHGEKGGFPVTAVTEIATTISPRTAQ